MGPDREIDDPALQRMKLGPDVEPTETELHKAPLERDTAATGGPVAPETGIGAARRLGLKGLLQILGPGLITGASDDDPSGIGTYSQAGAQFGFGVLWTALFTFPLMLAMQELCARIALHTGIASDSAFAASSRPGESAFAFSRWWLRTQSILAPISALSRSAAHC